MKQNQMTNPSLKQLSLEEKCALLSGAKTFKTRGMERHGIPQMCLSDGPHGIRKQAGEADHLGVNPSVPATCFPTAATVANSWDEALGEALGQALGEEAAAQGVAVLLGPGLNIKRSPLCGRSFEYFSEDPYLAGKLAAAYIRGIQKDGIAACPKHFAANSQETRRMASDSIVDERTLREIYLTGFEIAVKEGRAKTIMSAYNKINGVYANENAHLLMDILRGEWGFGGAVISDWGASNDHVLGVQNGSTLEMPAPGGDSIRELMRAVKSGKIAEAQVDARIEELLELAASTRAALDAAPKAFDVAAHHALARRAAAESIVLLKNQEDLLPLAAGTRVALIGAFAEVPRYQGAGSSEVNCTQLDTLLGCMGESGLQSIGYAQGYDRYGKPDAAMREEAAQLARRADVVLLCLGLNEINESEGLDRTDLKLAQNQIDLLKAVSAANPNVVGLLCAGGVVEAPWLGDCKALVYAALGGQAGAGALLDIVMGKRCPGGKLAETWPLAYEDTPAQKHFCGEGETVEYREGLYVGYRYYQTAKVPVRFPFGYGLSYTHFAYSGLRADARGVTFTITNTGKLAGAEIAQLYVAKPDAKVFRPWQELKGFIKVPLEPGESKSVSIPLDDKAFRYWNVETGRWEVEGGSYELRVGASSADIRLAAAVAVAGTGAKLPYAGRPLASYRVGQVQDVPDAEFQALLGHAIPAQKAKIDRNIIFGRMNHGRSPIFWLVWLVLTRLKNAAEAKGKPNLDVLFVYNMPVRALAKMTDGRVSMGMVDGIVMELQGFWVLGLLRVLYEWIQNLIRNAALEKRLAAADQEGQ